VKRTAIEKPHSEEEKEEKLERKREKNQEKNDREAVRSLRSQGRCFEIGRKEEGLPWLIGIGVSSDKASDEASRGGEGAYWDWRRHEK
jgi:hypothetical protein